MARFSQKLNNTMHACMHAREGVSRPKTNLSPTSIRKLNLIKLPVYIYIYILVCS